MSDVEDLLRTLAPQVLGRLIRRYGDFETCEDAVQEALLAAAQQWPAGGVPDNPQGWLVTVASRRLIEMTRNEAARRKREQTAALLEPPPAPAADAIHPDAIYPDAIYPDAAHLADDEANVNAADDSLTLLVLCCHPALSPPSQVALTLRAVGGLSTAEIARAFLVPEPTTGQRISRAKQRIKASGAQFRPPSPAERPERIAGVLQVLYLIFNEGYTASSGPALLRNELSAEAIRLTRQLHASVPGDDEVAGLLALMLLTDARRAARATDDGTLVPLAEQDRERWDHRAIDEGVALVTRALADGPVGPYQLQAAIAAVHAEAPRAEDTDWPQILGLYNLLDSLAPGPMVTLNRIVAVAMVHGATEGLRQLEAAAVDDALAGHHRLDAVRAHLLEMVGDVDAARAAYLLAARRTLSIPEQRYLESRASALAPAPGVQ